MLLISETTMFQPRQFIGNGEEISHKFGGMNSFGGIKADYVNQI